MEQAQTGSYIVDTNSSSSYFGHKYEKILRPLGLVLLFLNVGLVVIFLLASPLAFPWFIYPIYASLMFYSIFFVAGSTFFVGQKGLTIHGIIVTLTSIMLVFTNEHAGPYPWSFYPVISMICGFVIHVLIKFRTTDRQELFLQLHITIFSFVQCILFFAWAYSSTMFPWFLIPFFVGLAAVVLHYLLFRQRKRREMAQHAATTTAPSTEVSVQNPEPINHAHIYPNYTESQHPPQFVIQPFQAQTYQQQPQMYVPQPIDHYVPVQQPTVQMYPPVSGHPNVV
jgi:hypothetical protein